MESSASPHSEGAPRYKVSSFLFGNVDVQGQIEEYKNDEDLVSINNIDQCHVKEVEETAQTVLSNDGAAGSTTETLESPVNPISPADYYDEQEVLSDSVVVSGFRDLKPESDLHRRDQLEDYDDYDSFETSTAPSTESLQKLETTFPVQTDPQLALGTSSPVSSAGFPDRFVSESNSPESALSNSEEPRSSPVVESDTTKMPPPLHPAPMSASRQHQSKFSPFGAESSTQSSPSSSEFMDTSVASPSSTLVGATEGESLNTPLGSLMPAEYASVNIKDLFPAYNPCRPPRWGSIFKLPHSPDTYREFSDRAALVNRVLVEKQSNTDDRLHLVYDGNLDLGIIPRPEEIVERDEVVEFNTFAPAGTDFLAGHENSWWRRAYARALKGLNKTASSSAEVDSVMKKRSSVSAETQGKTQDETSSADAAQAVTKEEIQRGWRLGPAKYWYDQLGIPLDADITTWSDWRRPTTNQLLSTSMDDVDEGRMIVRSDLSPGSTASERAITPEELALSGSIKQNPDPAVTAEPSRVPSIRACPKPPENAFYPYQLINWEDDIIYDPQLSSNKIAASSRLNAAYAGWIPSQHCRTMAAFQDMYQGKFPYIVGSKALNGQNAATAIMERLFSPNKSPSSTLNPPYSIFPVENQGILSDNWVHDIIYDSDLPPDQLPPPFLLTLDYNDESCLLASVDDAAIAAAATNAVRGRRQQRHANSRPTDSKLDGTVGSGPSGEGTDTPTDEDTWNAVGRHGLESAPQGSSKTSAQTNRASLQVSFGLASTRGMLTGALAKAEHGAEKVKMILGKHGLLAEDDWQSDADKFAEVSDTLNDLGSGDVGGDTSLASAAAAISGIPPKDPLNLSNDEYYAIRGGALGMGGLSRCGPLQHSTPAVELWPPFFPSYMSQLRLRQFHRVPLKRYLRGPMSQYNIPFPVNNLVRQIQRKAREREEEKAVTGGGDIFFMRTPADLSGADGDVVLFEFSEEFPPLMTQIGMASRIINYYRPLVPRDRSLSPAPHASNEPPDLPYGSLVYVGATDSPFLGVVRPGGCLQTLENNMYRAPIYPHNMPTTDFLLIRNRNGISIRRIPDIFTVGQQIPLMEVPGPNSKRANNFVRDFLQVFILRLFLQSTDEPKRIKIEEIRKAFPNHSESSVRKRLKVCADFRRTGSDASWWVLRSDYRLPSEEEVRYLVSPEDCCAHYSMLAAELRLKDAGYGEKSLFVLDENQEDEEEKEGQPKMEDEVRAAPWNTTRAYLASQRGGCFLELHGAADPTGCGEAFSYSKTSAKPGALFRQTGGEVARGLLKGKRTVTGTDADLRKLHLRDARALLRSFGISEADLKTFKRWEIIDMVRFASTERAKQGEAESSAKFARGNRLSMTEQVRCYREECQRIFDLQNRVLSNTELLSSDEEVSSEEDEEEVTGAIGDAAGRTGSGTTSSAPSSIGGVQLSSLSASARSFAGTSHVSLTDVGGRDSERDRIRHGLESKDSVGSKRPRKTNPAGAQSRELSSAGAPTAKDHEDTNEAPINGTTSSAVYEASASAAGTVLDLAPPWPTAVRKMLRIVRTYSEDGQQYTRTELVPWSPVVEIYLKIRQTRTDDFIHTFVDSDYQFKEQQRREKRRLQDQLRRLRKQQTMMRERGGGSTTSSRPHVPSTINRRRTHKPLTSAQIKMRCGACGQTGHMRTNKECPMYGRSVTALPRSRGLARGHLKVPLRAHKTAPKSTDESRKVPDAIAEAQALASRPVCELLAEQDEEVVGHRTSADHDMTIEPMHPAHTSDDSTDQTGRFGDDAVTVEGTKLKLHSGLTRYINEQNRRNLKLKIRRQLLDRLNAAAAMVQSASARRRAVPGRPGVGRGRRSALTTNPDEFGSSLKHRGNRRRIDPRVALNHIFEGIYKGLTQIPGSKIFMHPVKEKDFPNYYAEIQNPMDLSQIRMKINENHYATREEFLNDIRLIYNNSLNYNGRYSSYTETAMKMCSHVMEEFCHKELKLMRLESMVNPLLDEDDLVGLSFLLQQAIESMRLIEHSRPFHTPVDKKRYPNYYKIISHPMDLSTLEKMVKENRFHSREEFFTQADLIYTNCVTFNGLESALTGIAEKMLAAGRRRLEQDEETLATLEANIRKQLESISASDSTVTQTPTSSKQTESRKSVKRLADISPSSGRPKKQAKMDCSGPDETASTPSDRTLRQRSGAWYGVDLEYEEDEDDDKQTATVPGELEDSSDKPGYSHQVLPAIPAEPWLSDEESMDTAIKRFTDTQERTDWQLARATVGDSPLSATPSTIVGDPVEMGQPLSQHSSLNEAEEEASHEVDEISLSGGMVHFTEDTEDSVDLRRWDDRTEEAVGSAAVYIDEDTQFSVSSRQFAELTDDLVAQDLQLTDSDNDTHSSENQGGELCTEEELVGHPTADPFDSASSQPRQTGYMLEGSPDDGVQPVTSRSDHVAFFIGDDEPDTD